MSGGAPASGASGAVRELIGEGGSWLARQGPSLGVEGGRESTGEAPPGRPPQKKRRRGVKKQRGRRVFFVVAALVSPFFPSRPPKAGREPAPRIASWFCFVCWCVGDTIKHVHALAPPPKKNANPPRLAHPHPPSPLSIEPTPTPTPIRRLLVLLRRPPRRVQLGRRRLRRQRGQRGGGRPPVRVLLWQRPPIRHPDRPSGRRRRRPLPLPHRVLVLLHGLARRPLQLALVRGLRLSGRQGGGGARTRGGRPGGGRRP